MGHWQYILYVNTTLFVLHCIIYLCSFIIPVRIQSFSWGKSDLQRTLFEHYFLWRNKRKRIYLLFPLHCDGELTRRLSEMSAGPPLTGPDFKHHSLSQLTGGPRCGGPKNPPQKTPNQNKKKNTSHCWDKNLHHSTSD